MDYRGALAQYLEGMNAATGRATGALEQAHGALSAPPADTSNLRMAAGFLAPTRTGGFGESLGSAVGNLADAREGADALRADRAMKIVAIRQAQARLQMDQAQAGFGAFEKGMEFDRQSQADAARRSMLGALSGGGMPGGGMDLSDVASAANMGATPLPGSAPIMPATGRFEPVPQGAFDGIERMNTRPADRPGFYEAPGAPVPPMEAPSPADMPALTASPAQFQPDGSLGSLLDPTPMVPAQMRAPRQSEPPRRQPAQQAPQGDIYAVAKANLERASQIARKSPAAAADPTFQEFVKQNREIFEKSPEYTSMIEGAKGTSTMREYEQFKRENPNWRSVAPTLLDYDVMQRRASATNVNVNGQERAFDSTMGKFAAETYQGIHSAANNARETINLLDLTGKALESGVYQGFGGQEILALQRMGTALGVSDPEQVAAGELITALQNRMALLMRNPDSGMGMPGAVSDRDIMFLKQAQVGLDKSPEGNRQLLEAFRKVEQRKIEIANMADAYVRQNGRMDVRFNQMIREYAQANPLFPAPSGDVAPGSPAIDDILRKYGVQ